jgi:hypothetical protein
VAFEGGIIEISYRAVIPRISLGIPKFHRNSRNSKKVPGIPMEFYANLFVIPKIIPNNSMEFQRIPWNSREFQN